MLCEWREAAGEPRAVPGSSASGMFFVFFEGSSIVGSDALSAGVVNDSTLGDALLGLGFL